MAVMIGAAMETALVVGSAMKTPLVMKVETAIETRLPVTADIWHWR